MSIIVTIEIIISEVEEEEEDVGVFVITIRLMSIDNKRIGEDIGKEMSGTSTKIRETIGISLIIMTIEIIIIEDIKITRSQNKAPKQITSQKEGIEGIGNIDKIITSQIITDLMSKSSNLNRNPRYK